MSAFTSTDYTKYFTVFLSLIKKRRRQWVRNINRKNWKPSRHSRICAHHFTKECFLTGSAGRKLNSTAVPTIFNITSDNRTAKPRVVSIQTEVSTVYLDHSYMAVSVTSTSEEFTTCESEMEVTLPESGNVEGSITQPNTDDHSYIGVSPKTLKHQIGHKLTTCRKKLKVEKQKTKLLQRKISSLTEVIIVLKQKLLISTGCAEMLEDSFSGVPKALLTRITQKKKVKVSEELRSFAMTLHFYSAKAYAYVRECFDLVLPHPETIRSWYSKISADPGFTQPAFSAIKSCVEDRKCEGKETLCALMMDEVAIRKHVEYAAGKFHGYVDLGCGIVNDSLLPAKDALVLMVVAIDDSWKIPVAYFLIDGLTGEECANIVTP